MFKFQSHLIALTRYPGSTVLVFVVMHLGESRRVKPGRLGWWFSTFCSCFVFIAELFHSKYDVCFWWHKLSARKIKYVNLCTDMLINLICRHNFIPQINNSSNVLTNILFLIVKLFHLFYPNRWYISQLKLCLPGVQLGSLISLNLTKTVFKLP